MYSGFSRCRYRPAVVVAPWRSSWGPGGRDFLYTTKHEPERKAEESGCQIAAHDAASRLAEERKRQPLERMGRSVMGPGQEAARVIDRIRKEREGQVPNLSRWAHEANPRSARPPGSGRRRRVNTGARARGQESRRVSPYSWRAWRWSTSLLPLSLQGVRGLPRSRWAVLR